MPDTPPKPNRVRLDVSDATHRALAILAGHQRKSMSAVARAAVEQYVAAEMAKVTNNNGGAGR